MEEVQAASWTVLNWRIRFLALLSETEMGVQIDILQYSALLCPTAIPNQFL